MISLRIVLLTVLAGIPSISQESLQEVDRGKAPAFQLLDLHGERKSLTSLRGKKITVLVFWATWGMDSCRMLDDMQPLFQKYELEGLQVLGICSEQQIIDTVATRRIADTVQRKGLKYPILLDEQLRTFRAYEVIAVPTTFVLDSSGVIVRKLSGYPVVGRSELTRFVTEQFEGVKPMVKYEARSNKDALRYFSMAAREFSREKFDAAHDHAVKALEFDSLFLDPLLLLAEIDLEQHEVAKASQWLDRALANNPESKKALSLRGYQYVQQIQLSQGIQWLTGRLAEDSTDVASMYYLAYAKGLGGNMAEALAMLKKAERITPADYHIPLLRARLYEATGNKEEAARAYREAKSLR